ncbi:hypothetical protein [Thalassotalea ganghwensis]
MSYKEKTIWLSLVILLLIWGDYGLTMIELANSQALNQALINDLLKSVIIQTIVLEIVLHIILAIINHKDANAQEDERDKLISLRATQHAYILLSIGVAVAVFYTIAPALNNVILPASTLAYHEKVIQIVIFFMVFAEVYRLSTQLFYYRRGF